MYWTYWVVLAVAVYLVVLVLREQDEPGFMYKKQYRDRVRMIEDHKKLRKIITDLRRAVAKWKREKGHFFGKILITRAAIWFMVLALRVYRWHKPYFEDYDKFHGLED